MRAAAFVALAVLLPCQQAAAQTFKCTDKAGKVVYTNSRCAELGLKDAGEVKERVNVTPAIQPTVRPSQTPPPVAPGRPQAAEKPPVEEKKPERRCFTVTAAGGKKVTRCNDKPED